MLFKKLFLVLFVLNQANCFYPVFSQQKSIAYKIGEPIQDFNLKDVDGSLRSLSSINSNGAIIIFTSNHCPYSKAYEARIIALDKKFKSLGFPVLAINANSIGSAGEDSPDENKIMANEKGYTFPYLKDTTQETLHAFGANRNPTTYIVKRESGAYILKYIGAIDDNPQLESEVTKKYIEMAINELLLGKNVSIATSKPIGCSIK